MTLALSWLDWQAVSDTPARTASARTMLRHRLNRTLH